MTEALGFLVSVVVGKVGVVFGAVVVGEFENGFAFASFFDVLLMLIGEEVEGEVIGLVRVDEIHAQDIFVEFERHFGVFDAEHHTAVAKAGVSTNNRKRGRAGGRRLTG